MGATSVTVLETVKRFWKLVSKNEISQTERFRTKYVLDVWKHIQCMCETR